MSRPRVGLQSLFLHTALIAAAAVTLVPLLWMVSVSLMPAGEATTFPPAFLPPHWTVENFFEVQSRSNYFMHFFNSIVIAVGSTLIGLIVCAGGPPRNHAPLHRRLDDA